MQPASDEMTRCSQTWNLSLCIRKRVRAQPHPKARNHHNASTRPSLSPPMAGGQVGATSAAVARSGAAPPLLAFCRTGFGAPSSPAGPSASPSAAPARPARGGPGLVWPGPARRPPPAGTAVRRRGGGSPAHHCFLASGADLDQRCGGGVSECRGGGLVPPKSGQNWPFSGLSALAESQALLVMCLEGRSDVGVCRRPPDGVAHVLKYSLLLSVTSNPPGESSTLPLKPK